MKRGFYTIIAAQFFSSLADNALLIVGIQMLIDLHAPDSLRPLLKWFFTVSYVVLAPFVGAFADSMPKGKVMFATNTIKVVGCILLFFTQDPLYALVAYAVVGFGAAAYSPAKYGILTELLPPEKLVAANGWIEGTTVLSIILGIVLGGQLVSKRVSEALLGIDIPHIDTGIDTPAEAAILIIAVVYVIASLFNLRIPDTGARYSHQERNPIKLISEFWQCNITLWRDKLGQISLAVTTLFWGAGATLQFIVLDWASKQLGLPLTNATRLQGVVAVGIATGAVLAARFVKLKESVRILTVGIAMGLIIPAMIFVRTEAVAYPMLILIGVLAGFFVVPMNALLQHRGHVLMSAGHSIAVQNFNENINILIMLAVYSGLVYLQLSVNTVIVLFGFSVAGAMFIVQRRHFANQRKFDSVALIGESTH